MMTISASTDGMSTEPYIELIGFAESINYLCNNPTVGAYYVRKSYVNRDLYTL
jgi:hypothetical protein